MAKNRKIINREISWLSFNHRVLQEAADKSLPLLERIRFLGIFSNNLDEFFKVRVATVKRMMDYDRNVSRDMRKMIGDKPKNVLKQIQKRVIELQAQFQQIYQDIIMELEAENIHLINEKQLTPSQAAFVKNYFEEEVRPMLSVIMLHNVDSFPYLKDKAIYLATKLTGSDPEVETEYALVEVPANISRFLVFPPEDHKRYLIILDDVIRFCLKDVFSIFHFDSFGAYTIKITRDAELDVDNDLSQSFIEKISKSVSRRNKGQPVRLVYDRAIPEDMISYIIKEMALDDDDNLIPGSRYHNFKDFMEFPGFGMPHLVYPTHKPLQHWRIKPNKSIFEVIAKKDLLLHYPYHKFANLIDWLREAAIDPKVVSVKITLYRVARNSKVINALINAARNGKQVTVIIELQARFDEKANIYWSRKMEEVGVRVLFGIRGLKVHCKLILISRREGREVVCYAGISTGNFHEGNAGIYSDTTLLTRDKRIASEVRKVFNFFDNTFKNFTYKSLLLSPNYARRRLVNLIDNEIRNRDLGRDSWVIVKTNSLVDKDLINKLYQAGRAGVKIRLIVRGICSLIPGEPGLSDNIEAISIVDAFLEHSRIFVFCNNNKNLYYISSADWMTRNLDHRIEVTCPVYDPDLQEELRTQIELQWSDNVKAREINREQDNRYRKNEGSQPVRSQAEFYRYLKNKT
ncbi:MAG: polyphosphate kinase 1 [Marinilabiliales bacterium]|nr:MAG: polyphosphate kinase 1 [Marinilabiliales bacterium]